MKVIKQNRVGFNASWVASQNKEDFVKSQLAAGTYAGYQEKERKEMLGSVHDKAAALFPKPKEKTK